MHVPKISIGLPVFNGERYLRPAVASILNQDYADFELIISDNASTDATRDICLEFASRDNRIRYSRNDTNIGASGNYNRVVGLARGEFFKWAAHDDVHLQGCLRRCIEIFGQVSSSTVLVAPTSEIIDENGNRTAAVVECLDARQSSPHERIADVLRNVCWAPAQFGIFRTEALKKTRLMQPYFASDFVLLVEVALLGEIQEFPEVLFQRRVHPDISTNTNRNWLQFQAWFDPSQKSLKRFIHPDIRVGMGFFSAIARMPMPVQERLLCYKTILTVWLPRKCGQITGNWRNHIALKTRLKKSFAKVFRQPV